jgi:hypothetical protein
MPETPLGMREMSSICSTMEDALSELNVLTMYYKVITNNIFRWKQQAHRVPQVPPWSDDEVQDDHPNSHELIRKQNKNAVPCY